MRGLQTLAAACERPLGHGCGLEAVRMPSYLEYSAGQNKAATTLPTHGFEGFLKLFRGARPALQLHASGAQGHAEAAPSAAAHADVQLGAHPLAAPTGPGGAGGHRQAWRYGRAADGLRPRLRLGAP